MVRWIKNLFAPYRTQIYTIRKRGEHPIMVLPGMTFQQYAEFTQLPSGTLLERGGDLYRIP